MSLRIDILSIFPAMIPEVLATSIPGRAAEGGMVSYHLHDIRAFADNKHQKVDDRPFGGGPGMVMMCQPLFDCVHSVEAEDPRPATRVLLTPQGEPLSQGRLASLAGASRLLLIAGHYEGIDERVVEELDPLELSLGDYVLSGGELAAMVLIDGIVRLLPGVLGHEDSADQDSFGPGEPGGPPLLDCPHYTRPREFRGREVPEVLLSGDHAAVDAWRLERRIERTRQRRPDLIDDAG